MCMPPFMIADDATPCERKCQIDASLQKTAHHQLPTKHLCSFLNLFLFNLIIVASMDAHLRLAADERSLSQMGHWNCLFLGVLLVLGCFTLGPLSTVPSLTFFKDSLVLSSHFPPLSITISGSGGSDRSPLHALHLSTERLFRFVDS